MDKELQKYLRTREGNSPSPGLGLSLVPSLGAWTTRTRDYFFLGRQGPSPGLGLNGEGRDWTTTCQSRTTSNRHEVAVARCHLHMRMAAENLANATACADNERNFPVSAAQLKEAYNMKED